MFGKTAIAATLLSLSLVGSGTSFAFGTSGSLMTAHEGHEHHDEKAALPETELCPVSGEALEGNKSISYQYKGKTHHFCCPDCAEEFKQNPEKYIKEKNKQVNKS